MIYRSHRGGVYYTPENTMPAFYDAIEKGFVQIETDPCYTKDGKIVLMHDYTINRTCKNADGTDIEKEVYTAECTYEELLCYDAGIHMGEEFKGTKIPLLEELLTAVEGKDITIVFDKKIETSNMGPLFDIVEKYDAKVSYLVEDIERIETILERFPDAKFEYDGPTTDEMLSKVTELIKPENLNIWLYLDKPNFWWVDSSRKVSEETCKCAKKYSRVGIANINNAYDVWEALTWEPDYIEV